MRVKTVFFALWLSLLLPFGLFAKGTIKEKANPKYAAIVIDANTGETLFARNADVPRYPASLTKMMTLYMVFEALEKGQLRLFQHLHVSKHATQQPPTKLNLRAGSTISVHDAILALIVKSANDVAVVVAEALGKTEKNFAQMMTRKARHLGLRFTTFGNASGLPNGQRHTTAREMAKLSQALYNHFPQFYHYFSATSFSYKGNIYNSHNKLVRKFPGCDGLKTGFTYASGYNLAASVKQGEKRIFAIVLGGRSGASRDQHMRELLSKNIHLARASISQKVRRPSQPPIPLFKPSDIQTVAYHTPSHNTQSVKQPITPQPVSVPPLPKHLKPTPPKAIPRTGAKDTQKHQKKWTVQVGAFAVASRAQKMAQQIQRQIPFLKNAQIVVASKSPYRAQISGLTQTDAVKACHMLKSRGQDCLVLSNKG